MIYVEPGKAAAFQEIFTRLIPKVLTEDGCIAYEMKVDYETRGSEPERFVIVERWENKAALDAHSAGPYIAAFREEVGAMIKNVDLIVTTGV